MAPDDAPAAEWRYTAFRWSRLGLGLLMTTSGGVGLAVGDDDPYRVAIDSFILLVGLATLHRLLWDRDGMVAELRSDRLVVGFEEVEVFRYADIRRVESGRWKTDVERWDKTMTTISHFCFRSRADVAHFCRTLAERVEMVAAAGGTPGPIPCVPVPGTALTEWRYGSDARPHCRVAGFILTLLAVAMLALDDEPPDVVFSYLAVGCVMLSLGLFREFIPVAELRRDRLVLKAGSAREAIFRYADIRGVKTRGGSVTLMLADGRKRTVQGFHSPADMRHFQRELVVRMASAPAAEASLPVTAIQ